MATSSTNVSEDPFHGLEDPFGSVTDSLSGKKSQAFKSTVVPKQNIVFDGANPPELSVQKNINKQNDDKSFRENPDIDMITIVVPESCSKIKFIPVDKSTTNSAIPVYGTAHTCKTCGKTFETGFKLANHWRTHQPPANRPKKYKKRNKPNPEDLEFDAKAVPKIRMKNLKSSINGNQEELDPAESMTDPQSSLNKQNSKDLEVVIIPIKNKPVQTLDPETEPKNSSSDDEQKSEPSPQNGQDSDDLLVPLPETSPGYLGPNDKYICIKCGKSFDTDKRLYSHQKVHAPDRQCPHCDIRIKGRSMRFHMQRHEKQGYFTCKSCWTNFKTQKLLSDHQVMHDEQPKYECVFCGRRFDTTLGLYGHVRIHYHKQMFSCDKCEFESDKKHYFVSHMEKHKTENYVKSLTKKCKVLTADEYLQMSPKK